MSWLQFIASMTGSLAWPAIVLVAIAVFHKPIGERIRAIHKLSHGNTEVLFDEQAREVQTAIAASDLPAEREIPAVALAASTNVGRVMLAWTKLEEAVAAKLMAKGADGKGLVGARLLEAARKEDVLTADQYRALSGLRAMRNLAAHSPSGEIDQRRLEEFLSLSEAMSTVLQITS